MHWLLKASIQGVLSSLPASQRWNYWFQRNMGSLSLSPDYILEKLDLCNRHLENYRRFGQGDTRLPSSVIELGTGWLPIVPIGMHLCGVKKVFTIDVQPLSNPALLTELLNVLSHMAFSEVVRVLPDACESEYLQLVEMVGQTEMFTLEQIGVTCTIGDARGMKFQSSSLDLVVSNNTLEHIPGEVIAAIFEEFHRVLRTDGLMSHLIDMQDHYSYFDHTLTVYHFLQHGEKFWGLVNNSLQYQNRLRISDHRALHRNASFEIVDEQTNPGDLALLREIKVAESFRGYLPTDLAATQSWIVSRPTPAPAARPAAG
ncbi:MAG TPA: class I SAM-dependent methyltransferase [Candidatus Limnocylindrales bacterium]|nr:class I SAM-dependent methyltransferase [Candidatus Limnocylindrales bacterium]